MIDLQIGTNRGTAVAVNGKAALFVGKSGSGKSGTGLQMITLGADLIADDVVEISQKDDDITVSSTGKMAGAIEARGIGILELPYQKSARLACVVSLDDDWNERLPQERRCDIGVTAVPLIFGGKLPNLSFAIYQFLRGTKLY